MLDFQKNKEKKIKIKKVTGLANTSSMNTLKLNLDGNNNKTEDIDDIIQKNIKKLKINQIEQMKHVGLKINELNTISQNYKQQVNTYKESAK